MWQIFTGSLILSLIHASVPNHWLPLISIGKAEKWSQRETLMATVITGFAHTLSTIIVGIIVGFVGYKLSGNYEIISNIVAPAILIFIGVVYMVIDFANAHHHHEHAHLKGNDNKNRNGSKWAILASLSISMFLTPCVEIEAYYFQAGTIGWTGIFTVSAVYTVTTLLLMLVLVYLGWKGAGKIKSHYLEHHEKLITGSVLVALGILAFFVS